MSTRRVFRPNRKPAAEKNRERALRDKIQRQKPTLEDLIAAGDCDPESVMSMGMYFDVQGVLKALKAERERLGLTISDVAEQSGLDRAVVSRLENGKQDNPTVATLMRYAAAVGKRFVWSYEDAGTKAANGNGKSRRGKRALA